VNPCIVNQDDAWNRMRLGCNLIEKGDYIGAPGWALLRSPGQLAVVAQGSEYVDALPMRQRFD
jgi:hypothetical protein